MPENHPARWDLPDNPSLEWLRTRAKRLRDAYAEGRPEAVELVASYDPPAGGPVPLARAQRVLARAFGFAGWSRLREHLATIEALARPMDAESADDGPLDRFLRTVCLSYTEPAAAETAVAMLRADPSLATAGAHAMAACGRAAELARLLDEDPAAVRVEGGPHRWPPLLYLAYSRLQLADAGLAGNPPATLRVLLERGADPDSGFLWKGFTSPFTAVTGVLGGGERGEPPHPQATALVTMLLDAGADPNDNQAFYNRMFEPDDRHLEPLLSHGAGHPHPSPWRDRLGAAYPSPQEMVGEHLRSAAEKGYTARVRRLLAHGVDPNTVGYHPVLGDATAYEMAVRNGHTGAAALLEAAGGHSDRLEPADLALSAVLAGTATAADLDPDLDLPSLRPEAVLVAAEQHGTVALERLLAVGYDVSAPGRWRTTALHEAARRGDVEMCRWLVAHGADRSAEDERFSSTPSGWAEHEGHPELARELAP